MLGSGTLRFHPFEGPRLYCVSRLILKWGARQHTHLREEVLDGLAHIIVGVVKLLGDLLRRVGEGWDRRHLGDMSDGRGIN